MCITCHFLRGSEAAGCVAEFNMLSGSGYTAVHISRNSDEEYMTGCVVSLESGEYSIDIYDIEKNGLKKPGTSPAVVIEHIQVSFVVAVIPTVTSATSVTSSENLSMETSGIVFTSTSCDMIFLFITCHIITLYTRLEYHVTVYHNYY